MHGNTIEPSSSTSATASSSTLPRRGTSGHRAHEHLQHNTQKLWIATEHRPQRVRQREHPASVGRACSPSRDRGVECSAHASIVR
jgi:hypothetical protein